MSNPAPPEATRPAPAVEPDLAPAPPDEPVADVRPERRHHQPSRSSRARKPGLRERFGGALFWTTFVLGFLVIGAYAMLCFRAGDKVPAGASVAGVEIGGLNAAAAEAKLTEAIGERADEPIVLTGAGQKVRYTAKEAGIRLVAEASVRRAGGGSSFWPGRIWRYYTGSEDDRDAVTTVSEKRFDRAVAGVVNVVGLKVVQGGIRFDRGQPVTRRAADGRKVETGDAEDALRHGFGRTTPSKVRWTTVEPEISNAAVKRALSDFAEPATSAPVDLTLDDHEIVAPPTLYTQAITMTRDDGELVPRLDVDDLLSALEPVMAGIAGTPQPAQVVIEGGKPRVVPSKVGVTFDRKVLQERFLEAAVKPKGERTLKVKGVSAPPEFTTADAKRMRITQQVASTSTPFGYADYRNTNIDRAADLLDGTIVEPGRTFSMESVIGEPTRAKGFEPGFEITGGVFKPDAGAGLSQVASTLYDAMFLAGLQDVDHTVPAVYAGRYPLGREATYDFGKADLRFTNDTKYGVLVVARSSDASTSGDGRLTIELWSTRTWDVEVQTGKRYAQKAPKVRREQGASCAARVGYPGFSVDVTRVFKKPGSKAVDHRSRTTTVYKPTDSVICDP